MFSNIKPLLSIALVVLLQSCVRDLPLSRIPNDKLLLSKVNGTFASAIFTGTNAYEFDDKGAFSTSFFYGKKTSGALKYRSLQKISFLSKGSWDFNYDSWILNKVNDYSLPQTHLGDWLFTYDKKYQVIEAEITKELFNAPSLHEYYTYNSKGQLIELIHGFSKENPSFKITYQYDKDCNLCSFDFCLANDIPSDRRALTGFRKNLAAMRKKNSPSTNCDLVFSATVTSDNCNNPFSQQDRLLFYPANRDNLYFNDFYLKLMTNNPLQVKYVFTDAFGGSTIVQTFKYTYNKQRYPITIEETEEDPGVWQFGDYKKKCSVEYIKND